MIITLLPEVVRELGVMSSGFRSARQLIFAGALVLLLLVRPAGILAFRTLTVRAGKAWAKS
jgi:hypothetical protein